ncbi:lasso peptide biosynthesis B2 protein [Paenibacillus sambharensis]|uniref:Lasso peptide biosynthesis B2 protein n=1 Tax=Paenibacillus sambharensis TaxID=1803190 RepID=A0A2W1LF60_9BACL|nr:lasso peptide biosynthesis B2 protein [Paenibacillus sambharensis]PZD97716.1 lasso peptide biosynthesis B2 protein [Paenibacillus sambharensis]
MWRKIRKLAASPLSMKLLMIEAFFCLGWARILKAAPFAKVAPSLGIPMEETPWESDPAVQAMQSRISHVVRLISRYTWWESQCLVMAIAAMKMMRRRRIESTLYLGTGRDDNGSMIAHAWLRSGPYYITGYETMSKFTVVGTFACYPGRSAAGYKKSQRSLGNEH